MYTMAGTAKDVVVKDCKGSRVDVGNGLLNNNNLADNNSYSSNMLLMWHNDFLTQY